MCNLFFVFTTWWVIENNQSAIIKPAPEDDSTQVRVATRAPSKPSMCPVPRHTRNSMPKMWFCFTIFQPYFCHKNVRRFQFHLDRPVLMMWLWSFVPWSQKWIRFSNNQLIKTLSFPGLLQWFKFKYSLHNAWRMRFETPSEPALYQTIKAHLLHVWPIKLYWICLLLLHHIIYEKREVGIYFFLFFVKHNKMSSDGNFFPWLTRCDQGVYRNANLMFASDSLVKLMCESKPLKINHQQCYDRSSQKVSST